jgi:hypothetical protein
MESGHGSAAFAEQNTCTRFCRFKHVFGNVWECMSHAHVHVCDMTCQTSAVRATANALAVCPLANRTFTDVAQVKRKTEDEECRGSMKRPGGLREYGIGPQC